jgi:hypothetical protein
MGTELGEKVKNNMSKVHENPRLGFFHKGALNIRSGLQGPFSEKPSLEFSWIFEMLLLTLSPKSVPVFIFVPFCSRSCGFLDFFYWTICLFGGQPLASLSAAHRLATLRAYLVLLVTID